MKISKLFHWLYAFLMFLPITFILPTLMYFGFNDNATAQEYTEEVPNYYESNEVSSVSDLVHGRVYTWIGGFVGDNPSSYTQYFSFNALSGLNVVGEDILYRAYQQNNTNGIWAQYPNNGTTAYINITNLSFDFKLIGNEVNIPSSVLSCISICDNLYQNGTYSQITYTMGITESVNQAIIDTFDLPMFAWATNNVLVAPFSSICSFFGIASTSVLIKYLYYWLTISVIWLVFDVLMYIPLLVHNYIDKARIE